MEFRIGLENNPGSRSIAWVLGHPGCYSYGINGDEAMANAAPAIEAYGAWIGARSSAPWLAAGSIEIHLEEQWTVYTLDENFELARDGYEVESFFRHDWKPLVEQEIDRARQLLAWSRADLLEAVRGLDEARLARRYPNERWSIAGILGHVGGAEWWYLDRLGLAFPRADVPLEPFERLEQVRARLLEVLPQLVASGQVVGLQGELWSPRKLLRRAVWHERDHAEHIRKLLSASMV